MKIKALQSIVYFVKLIPYRKKYNIVLQMDKTHYQAYLFDNRNAAFSHSSAELDVVLGELLKYIRNRNK
jgi:hypothetical protein